MKLSFSKQPKRELEAAEIDLRTKLLEATIAAVEGKWSIVEQRIETAAMLTKHIRQAERRTT